MTYITRYHFWSDAIHLSSGEMRIGISRISRSVCIKCVKQKTKLTKDQGLYKVALGDDEITISIQMSLFAIYGKVYVNGEMVDSNPFNGLLGLRMIYTIVFVIVVMFILVTGTIPFIN